MSIFRRSLVALATFAIAVSCVPPAPSGSPTSSPSAAATSAIASASAVPSLGTADMSAVLLAKALPDADIFDLTRRLRGKDGQPAQAFQPVRSAPPVEAVGASREFWTYDFAAKKNLRITATLRVLTEHAKWWTQNDIQVDLDALRTSASFFESRIYPTDRKAFGEEWSPGIDGDPHIDVLVARIPGAAAGYFNSSDELPLWVNPFSAEREMVYVNSLGMRPATTSFNSVLAHEFCHMIQFNKRKRSSVWFNEGQAQLCEQANGFVVSHAQTFLQLPDTQLNDWPELEQSQASYGVAFLFLEFLRQQAGGDDLINAFMAKGIDTPADLDAVLRARGQRPLEELFGDFAAANAFIGAGAERRYSYPDGIPFRAATSADADRVAVGGMLRSTVHEYATRYVELPRAAFKLRFEGARQTKLLPVDAHSGKTMWWSDRADGLDSKLTRTVDLRGASRPMLSFWTWFEIEKDYDYAYVAVSTDGGARWTTLPAQSTTTEDPNGDNLGNGFTGSSGDGQQPPKWIKQDVDLSAYSGKEILLRFEYVTDPALNLHGMALDDIEVSGLFADDAEGDKGWQAEGFVRSTNLVGQRYVVQLLRFTDRGPTVERRSVDAGTLELDVNTSGDRRPPLLAVIGFAVRTTQPASFEVSLSARP